MSINFLNEIIGTVFNLKEKQIADVMYEYKINTRTLLRTMLAKFVATTNTIYFS